MRWRQRPEERNIGVQTTTGRTEICSVEISTSDREQLAAESRDGGGPRLSYQPAHGQELVPGPRERHHLGQLGGVRGGAGSFEAERTQKW